MSFRLGLPALFTISHTASALWNNTILDTTNLITAVDCDSAAHSPCRQACRDACPPLTDLDSCLDALPEGCSFQFSGSFTQRSAGCKIEVFHEPLGTELLNRVDYPEYDNYTAITTPLHFPLEYDKHTITGFRWSFRLKESVDWNTFATCNSEHTFISFGTTCGVGGSQPGMMNVGQDQSPSTILDAESRTVTFNLTIPVLDALLQPGRGPVPEWGGVWVSVWEPQTYDNTPMNCLGGVSAEGAVAVLREGIEFLEVAMEWHQVVSKPFVQSAEFGLAMPMVERGSVCTPQGTCEGCKVLNECDWCMSPHGQLCTSSCTGEGFAVLRCGALPALASLGFLLCLLAALGLLV